MLPGNGGFSTPAVVAGSIDPVKRPGDFLIDYERGGIALNDPSQGLLVQIWKLRVTRDPVITNLWNFYLDSPSNGTQFLFSANGVKEAALSFDQNMRPMVVYIEDTTTKMWWYDPTIPGQTVRTFGTGYRSPRCTMDERRPWHLENSDIQFWYVRGSQLCVRYQRERFDIEHEKKLVGPQAELVSVTMATNNRLRWRLRNSNVSADDNQAKIQADPLVSDIVFDLCKRAGINDENLDVNDLYQDSVPGYLVAREDTIDRAMKPLADAFFFDAAEFDRKLYFLKRGRQVSFRFTWDDLLEEDVPMKNTIVDETKLPKQVIVRHQDPDGGLANNTQNAYRKSNMVKAKGKEKLEFDFGLYADQAATIALKYIKMKWHEPMTYAASLPIAFSYITPGDVGEYVDEEGSVHVIRCETRNEADGVIKFEFDTDGGADVYGVGVRGNPLPPPTSTTPGLVGHTRIEILNLPPLRDEDDELGVYVAVAGESNAWYGAAVNISTDGGLSYVEVMQTEIPATLGDTFTELLDETSAEYRSDQTLIVSSNFELESVTREVFLNNYNRAVVGDEIIQFQTAVPLGDNKYLLGNILRGRYNTKVEAWPVGTRFVLIDTSLNFVQAQRWMLGMEITFLPVSFGATEDDDVPTSYDYLEGVSQIEWPPANVVATRAGSDVTVEWIGRGRLGVEIAPRQGRYFTGYKLRFSDGVDIVVGNVQTYTRTGTPVGVTVQVCGTNSITGDGEYSEAVAT